MRRTRIPPRAPIQLADNQEGRTKVRPYSEVFSKNRRCRAAPWCSRSRTTKPSPAWVERPPDGLLAPLAWQAPRLEFADTPLSEVVARFNRYSRVQLELGDAELAARPVGGTFNADNAEAFVGLLLATGDVRVECVSDSHLVLRKAR